MKQRRQYDPEADAQAHPGSIEYWGDLDGVAQAKLPKAFRVQDHQVYTVALSPWTEQHLRERLRSYHTLPTGARASLENGRGDQPFTHFAPLKVLCVETSAEAISGIDLQGNRPGCPVCALRRYLCDRQPTSAWQFHSDALEPHQTVSVELGIVAIDGLREVNRYTHLLELPLKPFSWKFHAEQSGRLWRLWREDHKLRLEPTGEPVPATPRFNWGRTLYVRPASEEFLLEVAQTMVDSRCARPEEGRADWLRELFPGAVFVPTWFGTKNPMRRGYPEFASRWMKQWDDYSRVLDSGNIHFQCGPKSDNQCSFDFDDMKQYEAWRKRSANAWAAKAPKVWGKRGLAVLFKVKGPYPSKVFHIERRYGGDVGELRLGQLQTLSGLHPSGIEYRLEPGELPEVTFEQLQAGLHPRWLPLKAREEKSHRLVRRDCCALDLSRLRGVKKQAGYWDAQCPSCHDKQKDTAKDNLRIWPSTWGFSCIAGCSREEILEAGGRVEKVESEEFDDDEE